MKSDYFGILLEEIRDQNRAVLMAVTGMQEKIETLATQVSLDKLISRVSMLERALTDTNKELRDHISQGI